MHCAMTHAFALKTADFIAAKVDGARWHTHQVCRIDLGEWLPGQAWIGRLTRGVDQCQPAQSIADLRVG